jgi:hypothetical protein
VALAGREVQSALYLEQLIAAVRLGQHVPLAYVRNGQRYDTALEF